MEFKDTRGARRYNMAKKKISENPKAVDARARKEDKKQAVKSSKEKAEEDAMWKDDDKKLAKAAAKKADDERKKAEAAAKKAEMKALLKADEEALALKPKKAPAQKVTQHELHTKKVKAEEAARLAQIEKDRQNGIVTQDHLETFENQNRELAEERADGSVMASGLDAAITDLSIGVKPKTAKELRIEFEVERNAALRIEFPRLKKSQYQQMVWKEWLKSPRNPQNQKA